MLDPPPINRDTARDHLYNNPKLCRKIVGVFHELGVGPERYRMAIDLAAGNGSVAAGVLLALGWRVENITSVDIAVPDPDFSPGTKWIYLDLDKLGHTLSEGGKLPRTVEQRHGRYDFCSAVSGFEIMDYLGILGNFFLKKGGLLFASTGREGILYSGIRDWKQFGGVSFLFEKT